MSTKIIENFQPTVLYCLLRFLHRVSSEEPNYTPPNKTSQHPISKKLQNFCNCLYLNNFKFIKFYIFTRCTESSKIIALQLCSYLLHSDAISLYIAGALVLSTLTIYTFFNKTIINLKLSYYEQPTNPTKI